MFVETHPRMVEENCLKALRGLMEIILGLRFVIYIANLPAKALALPKYLTVTLAANVLPSIIHGRMMSPTHGTIPNWTTGHTEKESGWKKVI